MESRNESNPTGYAKSTTICQENANLLPVQLCKLSSSALQISPYLSKDSTVHLEKENQATSMVLMDFKEKLKHFDEHYDKHVNEIMSDSLHRGDVVSPQRMLGYADAMMATCATFLVIPLRKIKDIKPGTALADHLYMNRTEFIMFFLGYLVVLTIWESINIRSLFIKRVDDMLLFMTMFSMFTTSLLPFSLSLEGHYPGETVSVWISCSLLAIIELTELFIFFYSMEHPGVLHFELHNWTKPERRRFRNMLCLINIVNIAFIILGSLSILLNHVLAWVFIAMLILMPSLRKLFFYIRRRMISQTYFGIFAIVSTLWYANHGVLHLFKATNVIVIYLQKFSLAFACLTPLAGNMVVVFSNNKNHDAKKSILTASMVIFLSSFFNLLILIYGLYTKEKYLHGWAVGNKNLNKYQQRYTILKTANFPFWSLLCTLGSRLPESVVFYVMCVCFCCSLATFIILKLIFDKLIGKEKFLLQKHIVDITINTKKTESEEEQEV